MADREYFSLRYAVPGYAFLLPVIGINLWPLREILETPLAEAFGAFLGFLSLFAGSAIGFLVSQIWYWWFNRSPEPFRIKELRELAEVLVATAELDKKLVNTKDKIEAVSDYVYNVDADKNDRFLKYSERRWDMYLLMSCALVSVWIGIAFGSVLRIYFQFCLFNGFSQSVNWAEISFWIIILATAVILSIILYAARHRIMEAYLPFMKAYLRQATKTHKKRLKEVFPEYFPPETKDKS